MSASTVEVTTPTGVGSLSPDKRRQATSAELAAAVAGNAELEQVPADIRAKETRKRVSDVFAHEAEDQGVSLNGDVVTVPSRP